MKPKLIIAVLSVLFGIGIFIHYEIEYWTPRIIIKYAMTRK